MDTTGLEPVTPRMSTFSELTETLIE